MEKESKIPKTKRIILSICLILSTIILTFLICEVVTMRKEYYIGEKNLKIPIFVYHEIVENSSQVEDPSMQTPVDVFEKQIKTLKKIGYTPISYEDLVQYKEGKKKLPKRSYLITFDDGYIGIYNYAFQIAKKYNIPMTSFAIDDCVGAPGYYNWEQAKEMHDSGLMAIYSHGLTHAQYNLVEPKDFTDQINTAYKNLNTKLQDENMLKVFTYPYGLYSEEELQELEKYNYVQNLTDGKINRSNKLDLSRLHRIYPLNDSAWKIVLKIEYKSLKYRN